MIPKFRCFVGNKRMFEVEAIDFVEETVQVPVYDKETGEYLASAGFNFDDIILMQSTGLFDKKGVEIFDGDVVIITDYDEFPRTVVRYVQGTYCLFEGDNCLEALTDYYEDMEIIGNIHEHPELVEGCG